MASKIGIILGTRPEIIKLSGIITLCEKENLDYFIIHTNQHYSDNMDKIFFEQLHLPNPKYNLNVGSGTHGKQTGVMLEKIEEILILEKPTIILVQGDTNTVLAGALAASKLKIKVGHVEAGLRSYDKNMPEETNRILTDHMSDYLFVPTENQKKILIKENIPENKIFIVGNTIVDAVYRNVDIVKNESKIQKKLNLKEKEFILVTSHREENVDQKKNLMNILEALDTIHKTLKLEIIYPMHPRTKKMIDEFNLKIPNTIRIIEPLNFVDFLWCETNAKAIITDSGGVQEEACILGVPCVTIRENTERPETIEVGANILAGTNPSNILKSLQISLSKNNKWDNPFGDGFSSKYILDKIK